VLLVRQEVLVLAEHNVAALALGRALFQVELMVGGRHAACTVLPRVGGQPECHVGREVRQHSGRVEEFAEAAGLYDGRHRGHHGRGQQRLVHGAESVMRSSCRHVVHRRMRRLAVIAGRFLFDAGRVQQVRDAELAAVPVGAVVHRDELTAMLHHAVGRWLRVVVAMVVLLLLLLLLQLLLLVVLLQLLIVVVVLHPGPVLWSLVATTAVAAAAGRRRRRRRQYHARNGRRAHYVLRVRYVTVAPSVFLFLLAVRAAGGVLR